MKKRVEDVMPIATGHEREELEAELEVILHSLVFSFSLTGHSPSLLYSYIAIYI